METLSDEVLLSILQYLGPLQCARIATVNKQFARVTSDPTIYTSISFSDVHFMTNPLLELFARVHGSKVQELNLKGCKHIRGDTVVRVVQCMPQLRNLVLTGVITNMDETIEIVNSLPQLRVLRITPKLGLPEGQKYAPTVAKMAEGLAHLRQLHMELITLENMPAVAMMVGHAQALTHLTMEALDYYRSRYALQDHPIFVDRLGETSFDYVRELHLAYGYTMCHRPHLLVFCRLLQRGQLKKISLPMHIMDVLTDAQFQDFICRSLVLSRNSLTHVDLSSSSLRDDHCKAISCLHELTHLNLQRNKKLTGEGLCAIAAGNSNLTHLDVSGCYDILTPDLVGLEALVYHKPRLLFLNLAHVPTNRPKKVCAAIRFFRSLRYLAMPDCAIPPSAQQESSRKADSERFAAVESGSFSAQMSALLGMEAALEVDFSGGQIVLKIVPAGEKERQLERRRKRRGKFNPSTLGPTQMMPDGDEEANPGQQPAQPAQAANAAAAPSSPPGDKEATPSPNKADQASPSPSGDAPKAEETGEKMDVENAEDVVAKEQTDGSAQRDEDSKMDVGSDEEKDADIASPPKKKPKVTIEVKKMKSRGYDDNLASHDVPAQPAGAPFVVPAPKPVPVVEPDESDNLDNMDAQAAGEDSEAKDEAGVGSPDEEQGRQVELDVDEKDSGAAKSKEGKAAKSDADSSDEDEGTSSRRKRGERTPQDEEEDYYEHKGATMFQFGKTVLPEKQPRPLAVLVEDKDTTEVMKGPEMVRRTRDDGTETVEMELPDVNLVLAERPEQELQEYPTIEDGELDTTVKYTPYMKMFALKGLSKTEMERHQVEMSIPNFVQDVNMYPICQWDRLTRLTLQKVDLGQADTLYFLAQNTPNMEEVSLYKIGVEGKPDNLQRLHSSLRFWTKLVDFRLMQPFYKIDEALVDALVTSPDLGKVRLHTRGQRHDLSALLDILHKCPKLVVLSIHSDILQEECDDEVKLIQEMWPNREALDLVIGPATRPGSGNIVLFEFDVGLTFHNAPSISLW